MNVHENYVFNANATWVGLFCPHCDIRRSVRLDQITDEGELLCSCEEGMLVTHSSVLHGEVRYEVERRQRKFEEV